MNILELLKEELVPLKAALSVISEESDFTLLDQGMEAAESNCNTLSRLLLLRPRVADWMERVRAAHEWALKAIDDIENDKGNVEVSNTNDNM